MRGSHASNQVDMFLGTGCFEIAGMTYDRGSESMGHKTVGDGNVCIYCHMEESSPHGYPISDHTFEAYEAACTMCHNGQGTFPNYNNLQTEIADKLAQVENWLSNLYPGGNPIDSLTSTTWINAHPLNATQREALYGYKFVRNDGSLGVHNPAYALSVINNSLAALGL